jgi:sulfur relay (sulfurtransferase) DsrC/TusE family protein
MNNREPEGPYTISNSDEETNIPISKTTSHSSVASGEDHAERQNEHKSNSTSFPARQPLPARDSSVSSSRSSRRRRREGKEPEGSQSWNKRIGRFDNTVISTGDVFSRRTVFEDLTGPAELEGKQITQDPDPMLEESRNWDASGQMLTQVRDKGKLVPSREREISRSLRDGSSRQSVSGGSGMLLKATASQTIRVESSSLAGYPRDDTASHIQHIAGSSMDSQRPVPPPKYTDDLEGGRNSGYSNASHSSSRAFDANIGHRTLSQDQRSLEARREHSGSVDASNSALAHRSRMYSNSSTNSSGFGDDWSLSGRKATLLSRMQSSQTQRPQPSPEVILPRWQPDVEVTFCPICRTQFSKPVSLSPLALTLFL